MANAIGVEFRTLATADKEYLNKEVFAPTNAVLSSCSSATHATENDATKLRQLCSGHPSPALLMLSKTAKTW